METTPRAPQAPQAPQSPKAPQAPTKPAEFTYEPTTYKTVTVKSTSVYTIYPTSHSLTIPPRPSFTNTNFGSFHTITVYVSDDSPTSTTDSPSSSSTPIAYDASTRPHHASKGGKIAIAVGVAMGVLAIAGTIAFLIIYFRRRRIRHAREEADTWTKINVHPTNEKPSNQPDIVPRSTNFGQPNVPVFELDSTERPLSELASTHRPISELATSERVSELHSPYFPLSPMSFPEQSPRRSEFAASDSRSEPESTVQREGITQGDDLLGKDGEAQGGGQTRKADGNKSSFAEGVVGGPISEAGPENAADQTSKVVPERLSFEQRRV